MPVIFILVENGLFQKHHTYPDNRTDKKNMYIIYSAILLYIVNRLSKRLKKYIFTAVLAVYLLTAPFKVWAWCFIIYAFHVIGVFVVRTICSETGLYLEVTILSP